MLLGFFHPLRRDWPCDNRQRNQFWGSLWDRNIERMKTLICYRNEGSGQYRSNLAYKEATWPFDRVWYASSLFGPKKWRKKSKERENMLYSIIINWLSHVQIPSSRAIDHDQESSHTDLLDRQRVVRNLRYARHPTLNKFCYGFPLCRVSSPLGDEDWTLGCFRQGSGRRGIKSCQQIIFSYIYFHFHGYLSRTLSSSWQIRHSIHFLPPFFFYMQIAFILGGDGRDISWQEECIKAERNWIEKIKQWYQMRLLWINALFVRIHFRLLMRSRKRSVLTS
jgi:hypothetical protein